MKHYNIAVAAAIAIFGFNIAVVRAQQTADASKQAAASKSKPTHAPAKMGLIAGLLDNGPKDFDKAIGAPVSTAKTTTPAIDTANGGALVDIEVIVHRYKFSSPFKAIMSAKFKGDELEQIEIHRVPEWHHREWKSACTALGLDVSKAELGKSGVIMKLPGVADRFQMHWTTEDNYENDYRNKYYFDLTTIKRKP